MRQITNAEWAEYEWIEVSTFEDDTMNRAVFIRGRKLVDAPDDGFHYVDRTDFAAAETRWIPAVVAHD